MPTPHGEISVYCSKNKIKVKSDGGSGILRIKSIKKPSIKDANVESKGDGVYEIAIEKGREYSINYQSRN